MSDHMTAEYAERFWTSEDGLTLFARDYPGAGGAARLPVVCIHGLTRNSVDFAGIAQDMAATGRRVLAIDVRGRGRSECARDPQTYAVPNYAGDTLELLRQIGIERAVFVGTSMGGLISLAVANKRPAACGGIILNDVGPEVDQSGIDRIKSYAGKTSRFESWEEAGTAMAAIGAVSFPKYGEDDWIEFAKLNHVEKDGVITVACDPNIAVNLDKPLPPKLLRWLFFKRAVRKCPTLVIRGENSDILSQAVAKKMARQKSVELASVQGIGHAPMLTEPDARIALLEFLAGLD